MRHNVGIVDHPVSFRNAVLDKVGQQFISNPRLSKSIEFIAVTKNIVNVKAGYGGQGRAQAEASRKYLGISVQGSHFLNL